MALTKEALKGTEALKALTEDQLSAIETLSANDEAAVIAAKYKTLLDEFDGAVKEVTGKDKPRATFSSAWVLENLKELKANAEKAIGPLQKKIETLAGERDELKKKIEAGATDEVLKKEHEDLKKEMADKITRINLLEKQVTEEKTKAEEELNKAKEATLGLRLDHEFQKGLTGVTFKDEKLIPVKVRETFIENAKRNIRAKYKPDTIKDGETEIMVFRDEKGLILNNPKNLQKPFLPGELLLAEIQDILDPGKKQPGTGTGAGGNGGGEGTAVDISGAKTRNEAVTAIRKALIAEGVAVGSKDFADRSTQLYQEHKVADLPMK